MARPSRPTSINVTGNADSRTITWGPPSDDGGSPITAYSVRYYEPGDADLNTITNAISPTARSYTHGANITNYGTWRYLVVAFNAEGAGSAGSDDIVISELAAPGVPSNFDITGTTTSSITASWSAPTSGGDVTEYEFQYMETSSTTWFQSSDDTSPVTISGLDANTSYTVRVRAINSSGASGWVLTDDTTDTTDAPTITTPGVPTSVSLTTVDHDSVRLTWSAGSGDAATSYQVETRQGTSGGYTSRGTQTSGYTLNGLNADTLYQGRVRATNSAGSSAYSSPDSTTTDEEPVTTTAPGVPTSVSISDTSSTTLTLIWSAPTTGGTPTTYAVQYKKESDSSYSSASDTTSPSVISNLDADALYDVRVRATNSAGSSTYVEVQGTTEDETSTEAPGIPTNISASAIDHNSISVSWTAPTTGGDAEYYKFRYRQQGTTTWTTVSDNLDATSHSIHTLSTSTTYQFQIRASNATGNSLWAPSTPVTATTTALVSEAAVPSEPLRLQVDSRSTGVLLTWLAPEETGSGGAITGYNIFRHDGNSWRQIEANTTSTSTTYTDSDTLDIGSTYFYGIRAINSSGAGKYSGTVSVLINPSFPSAPIRFQADAQSTGVVMAWLAPADNGLGGAVNGYNIWRSNGTVWTEVESDTGSTSTTYTDTSTLTVGNNYNFAIRAKNSAGNGEWSEVIPVLINPDLPSAPRRVVVTDSGSSIELSWLAPADTGQGGAITGYNIWRHDGNSWSEIEADTGSTTTSYIDSSSRTANVTYAYSLRAINSAGEGEWSEPASWTDIEVDAVEQAKPSAPRRFQVDARSDGVHMSWLTPTSSGSGGAISGYNIWRWHGGQWQEIVSSTNSTGTTYTETDSLTENDWYQYAIRAINGSGNGEWSAVIPVLINPQLPSAPRRLVGDAQSTGVELDWLAPVDNGLGGAVSGYNIWRWHTGTWTEIVADTGNTDSDYTDTASLTVGDSYWYSVRAINASGGGEWSGNVGVLINPDVPSAPLRLVLAETSSGVELDWLAPADNGLGGAISGYNIWRWNEAAGWVEVIATTGSTATSYTDSSTLAEGWYWWTLRAINASGEGEWSETSGVTTATNVPSAPASLYAVEVLTGVQLAWTAPMDTGGSPITGYRIWRSDGLTWTQLVADTGDTDTTYLDTMVLALGDGIYFYRVNALTANGAGDFSAAAAVQLGAQEEGTSEAPTGLVAVHGLMGAIELSWVEPFDTGTDDITGYQIECWTPDTLWAVCVEDTESTAAQHTVSRAVATGVNIFRVAAITDAGVGEYSLPATIFVDAYFGPAGGRKTLGDTTFYAPTLIAPPAVKYPVVLRDRYGYGMVVAGLYEAQAEWWSWTSQGGSDSAVIQVGAVSQAALLHALDWLDHDVMILQPGTGQVVWSGYVNSVTVPVGDFGVRRSLEGYANDLRVKWTRPATEHTGAVDFVHSAVNEEADWQQERFGIRSVLVQSDHTLVELDQDDVDRLLAEYQNATRTARMEQDVPAGARLECRGHAGRLDQRFFPTRAAGQYGNVTTRDDDNDEGVGYSIANNPVSPHGAIFQYADLNPDAGYGHGPRTPGWDQYLRRVRFWEARRHGNSSKQRFSLGLYALGSGNQPGAELSAERVEIGYQRQQNAPRSPNKNPLVVNWLADGDPLLKLPAAGWYFGLEDDSELHGSGFSFDRSSEQYWPTSRNSGRLFVRRQIRSGNYTAQTSHLCFDFFTGVTAEGLAKWMASDAALARGVFKAHPANAAAGVYGGQVGQYYEGDTTWRQAFNQLAYADRLCYAIDEQKLMRFWSADGADAEPVVWSGGGANMGSFIGRRVSLAGEEFLMTGASYDAMTGQVDFSSPGKPSATVAGARLGAVN